LRIWNKQYGEGANVTGSQATLEAFKAMAPGKRVVHLATHGFFIEKACGANTVLEENPLLRGGLAFAGANLRREGTPDGILTASEVAQMDLQGTEWVVLSGCDTGSGQVTVGEGLLGLRRAFQVAGVRTVIGSLWPVQDEETRLWMTSLYGAHFTRGLDTAEAVRDAQLARLRARRAAGISTHPFYWGGFVAVGDWR
jgi:CHAT domain-containing protein